MLDFVISMRFEIYGLCVESSGIYTLGAVREADIPSDGAAGKRFSARRASDSAVFFILLRPVTYKKQKQ